MADPRLVPVTIENAKIMWRNFSGKQTLYNAAGDRNFVVFLDKEDAEQLREAGWNVKTVKPKPEADPDTPEQDFIQVTVKFSKKENARQPRVVLITDSQRAVLGEEDLNLLDWAEIENADLKFRSFYWEMGEKHGFTAYLEAIFVTIVEDALEKKYGFTDGARLGTGENITSVDSTPTFTEE